MKEKKKIENLIFIINLLQSSALAYCIVVSILSANSVFLLGKAAIPSSPSDTLPTEFEI